MDRQCPQVPSELSEYALAMRSVRLAKNLCWWAIFLAVAAQLTAFLAVNFAHVVDAAGKVPTTMAYEKPSVDRAESWYNVLCWLLPATKFLALAAGMLLSLTLLVGLKISLVGRLGGAAGLTSAFFWSLILFALVVPWQQVLQGSVACGALYTLDDLMRLGKEVLPRWGAQNVALYKQVLYYARFLAYPAVVVLVWLIVQLRFARGWKAAGLCQPVPAPEVHQV